MIDITVSADENISFKEFQKFSKYKDLETRLRKYDNSKRKWSLRHDKEGHTKFYRSNP